MCKFFQQAAISSVFILTLMSFTPCSRAELNLERLPGQDIQKVKVILEKLKPLIEKRKGDATLATLSFEEIYSPLLDDEKVFLRKFQTLDPVEADINTKWQGLAGGDAELIRVENQPIKKEGQVEYLAPQYVPPDVYESFLAMMEAMQQDIGKRLWIESAYRSSAYQLYLFIYYLKNHDYSILETAEWNALPGYSEHGNPKNQALDLMNEEGINGEENPEDFENLPEYAWLQEHAHDYHFYLSYPRGDESVGIAFEPWHWHYEKPLEK